MIRIQMSMDFAHASPLWINFEGEEFYAPAKLEEYLTLMYGDYNQLPPVEDRVGHRPVEVSVTEELFTR